MSYIVLEIKTTEGTTTFTNPSSYTTKDSAEQAYHTLCATAATSLVETDTVIMTKEDGIVVKRECYKHET